MTSCKQVSKNGKLGPRRGSFYDNAASIHCIIHVFILLPKTNEQLFGVGIRLCLFIDMSLSSEQKTRAKCCASRVLPALRLVRTARSTPYSCQASMNGCKPACSTNYPIRNGYICKSDNQLNIFKVHGTLLCLIILYSILFYEHIKDTNKTSITKAERE